MLLLLGYVDRPTGERHMLTTVSCTQAGGNVGTILIPALLDAGFTVSALVRPSTNATVPGDVTVQRADYTDFNALVAAFKGQDAVISTIGTFSAHL